MLHVPMVTMETQEVTLEKDAIMHAQNDLEQLGMNAQNEIICRSML